MSVIKAHVTEELLAHVTEESLAHVRTTHVMKYTVIKRKVESSSPLVDKGRGGGLHARQITSKLILCSRSY